MPYTDYTIQITTDNVDQIEAAAKTQNWTLDHLVDNLEYHAKDIPSFRALVMFITVDDESGSILRCNDVPFHDDSYKDLVNVDLTDLLTLITK